MKLPSWLRVGALCLSVYVLLLGSLELLGQLSIKWLESRKPSGIMAENLLSHQEPVLGFALKKRLNENLDGIWSVQSNEWGFRENEDFPVAKPKDEIRIAVVGGSTVFGWGVNNDRTLPSYLRQQIAVNFPKEASRVRVINAGVPWYASWHESAMIYFRLLSFSPDWIVVFDGLNDTALGVSPSWQPIHEGYVDMPTRVAYEHKKFNSFWPQLFSVSPTFRYYYAKSKMKEQIQKGVFHPEVWDQYLQYWDHVQRLTSSLGIKLSLFFQPVMLVDKPLDIYETEHNGTSMKLPEFAETFRKQYLEGERRIGENPRLAIKSLRKIFATNGAPIYTDGLHYNDKGNEILARAIFAELRKQGLDDLVVPPKTVARK